MQIEFKILNAILNSEHRVEYYYSTSVYYKHNVQVMTSVIKSSVVEKYAHVFTEDDFVGSLIEETLESIDYESIASVLICIFKKRDADIGRIEKEKACTYKKRFDDLMEEIHDPLRPRVNLSDRP